MRLAPYVITNAIRRADGSQQEMVVAFSSGLLPGRTGYGFRKTWTPVTEEHIEAAKAHVARVLAGESVAAPRSRFERYTRTLRDDSNDPGAPGHERKASTTAGRHRATRPNLPFRFEWKPEYHPRDVHEHVGRMRARIDQGDEPWPLVTPNPEREAVEWAAKYLVVVIPLEDVPMYGAAA